MLSRTATQVLLAALLAVPALAHAQLFRAYLAIAGNDANPCTLAAPCRLLPAALNAVASGGEIWMLDSANYNTGPVAIAKSVSILAVPGAVGSIVAVGGNGLNIDTPGIVVSLRNLRVVPIAGSATGLGINIGGAVDVSIDDCLISAVQHYGVLASGGAKLRMRDTIVRNVTGIGMGVGVWSGASAVLHRVTSSGHTGYGFLASSDVESSTTRLDLSESVATGNGSGLTTSTGSATMTVKVTVTGSQIVQNVNHGVFASSLGGGPVTVSVTHSTLSNNGFYGIYVNAPTVKLLASGNVVAGNSIGMQNSGGLLESAGDNAVRNNTNPDFGVTQVAKQ